MNKSDNRSIGAQGIDHSSSPLMVWRLRRILSDVPRPKSTRDASSQPLITQVENHIPGEQRPQEAEGGHLVRRIPIALSLPERNLPPAAAERGRRSAWRRPASIPRGRASPAISGCSRGDPCRSLSHPARSKGAHWLAHAIMRCGASSTVKNEDEEEYFTPHLLHPSHRTRFEDDCSGSKLVGTPTWVSSVTTPNFFLHHAPNLFTWWPDSVGSLFVYHLVNWPMISSPFQDSWSWFKWGKGDHETVLELQQDVYRELSGWSLETRNNQFRVQQRRRWCVTLLSREIDLFEDADDSASPKREISELTCMKESPHVSRYLSNAEGEIIFFKKKPSQV